MDATLSNNIVVFQRPWPTMEALPMKHGLPWLVSRVCYCVPKRNMVYLGCDGNDVFQGDHNGLITQVRGQTTPLPP